MKFSIPQQTFVIASSDTTVGGRDISLRGGDFTTTANGDWATISGVDAARQSAEREISAMRGSFPRRPTWGGSVGALLFKGVTKATRDQAASASRAVLLNNPRIKRVIDVEATPAESGEGMTIRFDADAIDGRVSSQITVRPNGR